MFTFKNNNPTGKFRSFEKKYIDVKLNRELCGKIFEIHWDEYEVSLTVKQDEKPSFKWINFVKKFKTPDEAKTWLNKNFEVITKKYNIHTFKD